MPGNYSIFIIVYTEKVKVPRVISEAQDTNAYLSK
jgi:hypothetical protein